MQRILAVEVCNCIVDKSPRRQTSGGWRDVAFQCAWCYITAAWCQVSMQVLVSSSALCVYLILQIPFCVTFHPYKVYCEQVYLMKWPVNVVSHVCYIHFTGKLKSRMFSVPLQTKPPHTQLLNVNEPTLRLTPFFCHHRLHFCICSHAGPL